MPDFSLFRDTLLDRLRTLVEDEWAEVAGAALDDGRARHADVHRRPVPTARAAGSS